MLKNSLILSVIIFIASCNNYKKVDYVEIEKLNSLAHNDFINKKYYDAIHKYDQLITLDTAHKVVYFYRRGVCKSLVKDFRSSNIDLLYSIQNNYSTQYAYQLMAKNYMQGFKDTISAIKFINEAYRIDPKNESIIMDKLMILGEEKAFKFTLDTLLADSIN